MEDLSPPNKLFLPYFVANGNKIFGFGTLMDMQSHIQMNANKLTFDGDATNTYIAADTSTPENLEVHADGNIELRADDDLQVYSDVDVTGEITASGNISSSGNVYAADYFDNGANISSIYSPIAGGSGITTVGTLGSLTVTGNITANGNIVGDDGTNITNIVEVQCDSIASDAGSTTKIQMGAATIDVLVDDTDVFDVSPTKFTHSIPVKFSSHITSSGNISSSGTIIAATLDAAAVTDTLAAAIVAEIDNDEIPIAKLAEDSISGVALGSNLNNLTVDNATLQLNSGTTYNGSAARTISIKDGGVDSDALADDITVAGDLTVADNIIHSGDTDTKLTFGTDILSLDAGGTTVFSSTVTGSKVENVHQTIYDTGSLAISTANGAIGDIVKFGNISTLAGALYYLNSSGTWSFAKADAGGTATASLAIAVGGNSTTDGMCLRGFINPYTDPGAAIGNPVYLSDVANGRMLATAPDTSGDFVRVVGYQYGTDLIYFTPDNTWVEID